MTAPDPGSVVAAQMINPNDSINLYEGEGCVSPVEVPHAFDMRKWLRFLAWDLLRFAKASLFTGPYNPDTTWGLRDAVTRSLYLAELNNQMLQEICTELKITPKQP